jgi:hypothetical protein
MFHTHPQEPGYEWDKPSVGEDKDTGTAASYPNMAHYIVHDSSLIKFNGSGEINRKNNWKSDCGGTNNFLN